jgi:hypothetical protein
LPHELWNLLQEPTAPSTIGEEGIDFSGIRLSEDAMPFEDAMPVPQLLEHGVIKYRSLGQYRTQSPATMLGGWVPFITSGRFLGTHV